MNNFIKKMLKLLYFLNSLQISYFSYKNLLSIPTNISYLKVLYFEHSFEVNCNFKTVIHSENYVFFYLIKAQVELL